MCGLFLILERRRPVDVTRARACTQALRHRGPDGLGECSFDWSTTGRDDVPRVSGYAGHTRLSILDPSPRSDQPMRRGQHTLIYNGEIYNFRHVREALCAAGANFSSDGDTEVLLELLARQGLPGLNQAHGMWAFGLFDHGAGTLLAARDRYGKKPLFFHFDEERLCLASEIAPILRYLDRPPCMTDAALDTYLCDGWLFPQADGCTHVEGIREVPAGAAIHFDLGRWHLATERWFDLDAHVARTPARADELPELLCEAVLSRLVADRKVGLLLSGGVDSSLILSILCASGRGEQVHCFTGDAGKSDDAQYARRCIEQLGIRAIEVPLDYGPAGMDGFLSTCRHQEKPFPFIGNVLAMPQLYARIAEHDVPVIMDGTGGDEVFAGYWDRYYRFALREAQSGGDASWLEESLRENAGDAKAMRQALLARGVDPVPRGSGLRGAESDPPGLSRHIDPAVFDAAANDSLESFQGTLTQALLHDAKRGRLPEWLWQNDRNAMASGVENRSPLLDHRLAPYMRTRMQGKMSGPWNKLELRQAFDRFIALPTQWRRDKQGFRWVYFRFLRANRAAVLELVSASRLLPTRMNARAVVDAARHDDAVLDSVLLQRMLCIAGLEAAMGLQGAS
ncbi:asparagine synthase (glutamine-hydrolyzing) [Roseateles sp.]|uniref:asparagine synthase (glutamine-hydrolyzing) n=1 Tax=Roseateles sp. TaxID=1971397 RepID=UPI00286D3DE8|nr:asparagine synthase (glutamine-hydrolyzing) [Roseateles sp.]